MASWKKLFEGFTLPNDRQGAEGGGMSTIDGESKKLAEDILNREVYDWNEIPRWVSTLINDLIDLGWRKP